MTKTQQRLRATLTQHLKSLGIDKQVAHHEVGFLLNRRPAEQVMLGVMLHAKPPRPIDAVRRFLSLEDAQ